MVCSTPWTSTAEITGLEVSMGRLRETLHQFNLLILLQVSNLYRLEGSQAPGQN